MIEGGIPECRSSTVHWRKIEDFNIQAGGLACGGKEVESGCVADCGGDDGYGWLSSERRCCEKNVKCRDERWDDFWVVYLVSTGRSFNSHIDRGHLPHPLQ